jgi:hypothetical protein
MYSNGAHGCIVSKPSTPPPGANIIAFRESSIANQAIFVGQDGAVRNALDAGGNTWFSEGTFSRPGFAPPGAPLAMGIQNGSQIDVFFVGNDGAIYESYRTNDWNGPIPITPTGFVSSGSHLVAAPHPGANQLDLFYVNNSGAVNALWVLGASTSWNGPVALTPNGAAPAKAPLAAGMQTSNQLDVVYVGLNQAIDAVWVVGTSHWFGPIALSGLNLAPAGAPVATGFQGTQFDVFTVDWNGNVEGAFYRPADNLWHGPLPITSNGIAGRGANLATAQQNSNQLDVFYSDIHGILEGQGVQGLGLWSAPIPLSGSGFAPPGAPIATFLPTSTELDVLVATGTGVNFTYEQNDGMFQTPKIIYPQ